MQNNDYFVPTEVDEETMRQIDKDIRSMVEFQKKILTDIISIPKTKRII